MEISKLFMNVSKDNETAFLNALKTNSKQYNNKIVFVEGTKSNYIVVNGVKYGEFNPTNSFNIDAITPISSYDTIVTSLINAVNSDPVYLPLANDLTVESGKYIEVKEGADVTIDLSGHSINAKDGAATFVVRAGGKLHIVGDGVVEGKSTCIQNSGEVVIDGGKFTATYPIYNMSNCSTTINGGEFDSVECCCALAKGQHDSELIINGGTFNPSDNAAIMDNGTKDSCSGHKIVVNGGIFNCNIKSAGYIACGIYLANDNEVYLNGGTFNVDGGCGILVRAGVAIINGVTFNCTGTSVTGKVGDATAQIECVPVVFDEASKYPGLTSKSQVIIKKMKTSSQPSEVFDENIEEYVTYCYLVGDKANPTHIHNDDATDESRINFKLY